MVTVTISKVKYEQLKRQAEAYRRFAAEFFKSAAKDPIHEVVADFQKTDRYTKEFLQDLEVGLRRASSHKWQELREDFEDHIRCEIAIRASKGKRRYSLQEVKRRRNLK